MGAERYSRNEAFFGAEGQRKIAAQRVAIVGLGGLGSHIAQQLAYLGVHDYRLIDFDIVTDSSLNRLIGACDADVPGKIKKIAVAERMIRTILPDATVRPVDARLEAPTVEPVLASTDVVFGCLDRDLARLQLNELCARLATPLFDLASDTDGEQGELTYGGRVLFANGTGCLVCHGVLDQEAIRLERMTPEDRERDDRIYGVRRSALPGTGPMVVSVNGAVASLAGTEFMAFATGIRNPAPYIIYRGELPAVRRVLDDPEPDCYLCAKMWRAALAARTQ